MGDYKPPYTITNEMLSYVSSISEKIGRITATGHLEAKLKYIVEESGDFRRGEEGGALAAANALWHRQQDLSRS